MNSRPIDIYFTCRKCKTKSLQTDPRNNLLWRNRFIEYFGEYQIDDNIKTLIKNRHSKIKVRTGKYYCYKCYKNMFETEKNFNPYLPADRQAEDDEGSDVIEYEYEV